MKKKIHTSHLHTHHQHTSFLKQAVHFIRKNRVRLAILIALVVITYSNAIGNSFVSDDINGILKNRAIQDFHSVTSQPLSFVQPLYLFIAYKLFHVNPLFFHMVNILLHLGITLTVFILFAVLGGELIAFFGAALFAVHPLRSEPVVWVSANNYLLYSLYFLLSFLTYISFTKTNKTKWYAASLILFFLSLASSNKSYFLFLVFPAYEILQGDIKKRFKFLLPFLFFGLSFVTFGVLHIGPRLQALQPEIGSKLQVDNPFVQIPFALGSYLRLFFFPDNLTLYHTEYFTDNTLTTFYIGITILFALSLYIAFKKNKHILFWLIFFLISLLPTLSPFHLSSLIAERYVYLGSIGLLFVIALFISHLSKHKKISLYVYCVFILLLTALSIRTLIRNRDWQNEITLGVSNRTNPKDSAIKFQNSGNAYLQEGNLQAAIGEFNKAIALRPDFADLYNNLGFAYAHMNKFNEATAAYEKALKLNPKLWQTYDNVAAIYAAQKNFKKAESYLDTAQKLAPNNNDLVVHLGIVYLLSGDKKKAKDQFTKALVFDPNNTEARDGLKEASK